MAKQPNRKPSKVYDVVIGKMRVPPELVSQRPFIQAHGDQIASDLDLNKIGFPILNHRDGIFWILDGQHRIYALKQFGFSDKDAVTCEVYEGLTDAEMAEIFLGRDDRRAIAPFAKFHVACTAGRKRENDIRRVVESNGLKISQSKEEGCIGAVGALKKVYDRSGDVVVGQVVRTIKNAYAGDASAFDATVIDGLGLVFNRYNGRTNERELVSKLSTVPQGVRGLLRRSEAMRERTGNQKAQCVAATVVDAYNKGLGPRDGKRLPAWWKEA